MSKQRLRFIDHRGHRILEIDFTEMNGPGEALEAIGEVRRFVAQQPEGSLLTLTDVTGTKYDDEIIGALRDLAAHNKPFVRAAASVTRTPLQLVAIRASAVNTRRKMMAFDDSEAAKDWLVEQA